MQIKSLLKDIKESILGNEQDFTKGNIGKAILLLSIPMVLEMFWESLFAIIDIKWVSGLGPDAIAVVGLTESVMTLVYAIGIGFSMATTALVSRRIGEKRKDKAGEAAFQAILLAAISSTVFSFAGMFFSKEILGLMGASPSVVEQGSSYISIMLGGNMIIMLLFINNAIFRSAGDAAISMWVLALANLINIILDPLFIYGIGPFPEMGIKGAAIATNIGRGVAVIFQLFILFKGSKRIQITIQNIKINFSILVELIKLSGGGISQFLIATSSWIFIMKFMAGYGSEVIAGYTIGIRIIIFSILPSWGMSNAAATLVGQNLGAGQPDRAERSTWITAFVNAIFLLIISIFFYTVPNVFVNFFSTDKVVLEMGISTLQIICIGYLFYGFGMVMVQAFNGAGDTYTPTIINLIAFWAIEIPLAYILSHETSLNEKGILVAITIGESIAGILGILWFRKGKWKLMKV